MKNFQITLILLLVVNVSYSQIQIVDLPKPGFEERIITAVNEIWIIDTHEHLVTESGRLQRADNIDFTYLFRHYAKEDLISASSRKGLIEVFYNNTFPLEERWQLFNPFYKAMRSTGYGRVPLIAARDLFQINDINDDTITELSAKVKEATKPGWYEYVLKERAKIDISIQDMGHQKFDTAFYRHVERFDNFIQVSSKTEIESQGLTHGVSVNTLDGYLRSLKKAFEAGVEYGMVGVKSGLAYNRILYYENVPESKAEEVFNKLMEGKPARQEEVKKLQDYMMHRVLDLAAEYELPVQIHTGLHAGNGNTITNSKPTHLANLFMEHPDVNFCLFHGGYPYGGELATLAKNFPNVFIDMCWLYVISPSYSERYLHEWIETVPANKILGFGGDYSFVEAVYAHSVMARQVIAKVLVEKVRTGYLSESEAIDIAKMILRENAIQVFKLEGYSDPIENLDVLNKPGALGDWWAIHKTNEGFVRSWKVIGPFNFGSGLGQKYPPETKIDFSKSYEGKGGQVSWESEKASTAGYLNFITLFRSRNENANPTDEGIAYAYAEVISPNNREVKLTLGSNDGAMVWVNGEVVYSLHVGRNAMADQDFITVNFNRGTNKILVKVENLGANWGLYLRVINPEKDFEIIKYED